MPSSRWCPPTDAELLRDRRARRKHPPGAGGERCKPIPLGKRFLCYHDDDAEPDVAFDVYTAAGRKVLFYPITRDVLALKVSDDERNVAIALQGSQVLLFDPEFRSLWQRSVAGEVVDLAVSAGAHPRVAVLYNRPAATAGAESPGQGIALLNEQGAVLGETSVTGRAAQVEGLSDGQGFATFGNGKGGQVRRVLRLAAKLVYKS